MRQALPGSNVIDSTVHDDIIDWLLAGDPAIVWQTERDLLGLRAEILATNRCLGIEIVKVRGTQHAFFTGWTGPLDSAFLHISRRWSDIRAGNRTEQRAA